MVLAILSSFSVLISPALNAAASPDSITPSSGYNTGSVAITDLNSTGFLTGSAVRLARSGETDIPAATVSVLSSTRITCSFDLTNKTAGYWTVAVTTGSFTQLLTATFEVKAMAIDSITPYSGHNTGAVGITSLGGAGFVAGSTVALTRAGETAIPAASVSVLSSTQISCSFDLKGKTTGYWDLVVTTGPLNQTATSFFEIKAIEIDSIAPYAGYNTGAVSITALRGGGFVAGSTVALTRAGETAIPAASVSVLSSTQIACSFDLTNKTTGQWDVVVTTGSLNQTAAGLFEIRTMAIDSIAPAAGYNTGAVSITALVGGGFVTGSTVALTRAGETDIPAASVSVLSSTRITCSFDLTNKTTGYWDIVITTNSFSQTAASLFEIRTMAIDSIAPYSGYNTGTVSITALAGAGFVAGSTVALTSTGETDIPATSVSVLNSTQIACSFDLKGKTTGYWDVVVTTNSFSQTATSLFEIRTMAIDSIAPYSGYNTGTVSITALRGGGFVAGSTVALTHAGETDIPAASVSVLSSTQISCSFDLTNKTTGFWDVAVTTGPFSQTASNLFEIKAMAIDSIAPYAGYNTGPVSITSLGGAGFVDGSTVALTRSGETPIPAASVSVLSSTQISCSFDLTNKTTGYWDVAVTTGSFSQAASNLFEIRPMAVDSIAPAAGYNTGTVSITALGGGGFVDGSTVALIRSGETPIPAASVSVLSSTQISCSFDLTNKTTGYWDVVVTTGSFSQTAINLFEIRTMAIDSIAPAAGYNTGTVSITALGGGGFVAGSTVALTRSGETAIPAASVSVVSSTQIACSFDLTNKTTGYWNVVVTTGPLSMVLENGFYVNTVAPYSITPASAFNTGPVLITDLEGEGFASYTTLIKLARSGQADIPATDINVESPNKLTCEFDITGKAAGSWDVVVTSGAFSYTLANGFTIRAMGIVSVTPVYGSDVGSTAFSVSGDGFLSGSTVKLSKTGQSDIPAVSVSVPDPARITGSFDLTGKATGYWDLTVTSNAFSSTLSGGFEIKSLTVMSITPASGFNTGPVNITSLEGAGFIAGSTVALTRTGETAIPGTSVSVVTSTQITCAFDLTGKATGYWDVVLTSDSLVSTLPGGFLVKSLTLASISPGVGYSTDQAHTAELYGEGFVSGAVVRLSRSGQSDITATGVTVVQSTRITCSFDLTGRLTGYWDVVVSTGGAGSLSATLANGFLLNTLSLASITPAYGHNSGSVNVTDLNGGGFAAGAAVKLTKTGQSDIAATGVTVVSASRITCAFELAGKTTGYWNVVVSTGWGTGSLSATLANGFLVNPFSVASITPGSGYNSGSVSVTALRGGGFLAGAAVKLTKTGQSDIAATGVTVVSTAQLACVFDLTGKTTGYWDVVVSTGGAGSLSATLTNGFLVNPFSVASITPNTGPNSGSVNVTDLHGGGFAAGAAVKLIRTGQSDIAATSVTVVSQVQIACVFDLIGKTTGYWDVVVSTGGTGSLSVTLAQAFEVTNAVTETVSIGVTTASSVTLRLVSGDVKVEIPAGAFSATVLLTVSTAPVPAADRATLSVTGIGIRISDDLGLQPARNLALTVFYRNSDIAGLDEAKLSLGRYDAVNSRWVPLPSTVYPDLNKITAAVDHLSVFGLLQLKPAASLGALKVFPNPFDPGRQSMATIEGLPSRAEIKIFTVTGELVKEVEYTAGNGRAYWYGKNDAGGTAASGVYIVLIKAGGSSRKLKLAVEK